MLTRKRSDTVERDSRWGCGDRGRALKKYLSSQGQETTAEAIERAILALRNMGIDVVDRPSDFSSKLEIYTDVPSVRGQLEDEAAIVRSAVQVQPSASPDLIQTYLREMGAIKLLTRQGEIEFAQRIESARVKVTRTLLSCPRTVAAILTMAEANANSQLCIAELLEPATEQYSTSIDDVGPAEVGNGCQPPGLASRPINYLHILSPAPIFMEETIWKARPYTPFPLR